MQNVNKGVELIVREFQSLNFSLIVYEFIFLPPKNNKGGALFLTI